MPTIHLIIKGKVQGVFFRATAKELAQRLNLTGWVKNTEQGDVEATVNGDEEMLHKFIEWSKKGPPKAHVSEVIITELTDEKFDGFRIKKDTFL